MHFHSKSSVSEQHVLRRAVKRRRRCDVGSVLASAGRSFQGLPDCDCECFTRAGVYSLEHRKVNLDLFSATGGSARMHFGGHTSQPGRRRGDEHIILRTSLLTMPIYFDNQLTIVPVQPLKERWFIRIDQFWVTSCAALWGQTEAWLAVQSGMLSNAQAWLTAHQHAGLKSLDKCFPFTPTSDTHIKLWISAVKCAPHVLLHLHCVHIMRHFKQSEQFLSKTLNIFDDKPQKNDRIHLNN